MNRVVLSVNGGSSSLKLALFRISDASEQELARAVAERDVEGLFRLTAGDHSGLTGSQPEALLRFAELAAEMGLPRPRAVGHRLVHGGRGFHGPTLLNAAALATLRALFPLAPLHLPLQAELIEAARTAFPAAEQVGCFDTAFHHALPELAQHLPLPRALHERGVQRYGFHGLSYQSVLHKLGAEAAGRVVIAHLGAGSSLAAVRDGAPVDTTMGMTPAGGLMMGARCGDIDPGVLVHLLRHEGYDADGLDRLVNRESGLAGVSGSGADMRILLKLAPSDLAAELAVSLYCRIAGKHVAAMAASLGGIDQLVFTGGIGEKSAEIRARIVAGLEFLGLHLDRTRNDAQAPIISPPAYYRVIRVIATDEERMVARQTYQLTESDS